MIDAQLVNLDDRARFRTPVVPGSIGEFQAVPGLTDSIGARCPMCGADLATFVRHERLVKAEWDGVETPYGYDPPSSEVRAVTLVRAAAAEDAYLRGCAKATSVELWQRAWDRSRKAGDRVVEAANHVRLDLGMNPVPG